MLLEQTRFYEHSVLQVDLAQFNAFLAQGKKFSGHFKGDSGPNKHWNLQEFLKKAVPYENRSNNNKGGVYKGNNKDRDQVIGHNVKSVGNLVM